MSFVDRKHLSLHAFYVHANMDSSSEERIAGKFEYWNHVASLSDVELASYIFDKNIDILVDMSGHSGGNRLVALGMKPAPIQD